MILQMLIWFRKKNFLLKQIKNRRNEDFETPKLERRFVHTLYCLSASKTMNPLESSYSSVFLGITSLTQSICLISWSKIFVSVKKCNHRDKSLVLFEMKHCIENGVNSGL